MSVNKVNSDGSLSRVAGGTLYADLPIGVIVPFGGSVIPSGFLLCNGQAVSRTTYAELFAVIGTAFGKGDENTTFNVPDLREAVPKGVGLNGKSSVHYDEDGVALGEFIEDRVQDHLHRTKLYNQNFQVGSENVAPVTENGGSGVGTVGDIVVGRHGATTEVKAVGANYIIKAKQVAVPADFMDAINNVLKVSEPVSATNTEYTTNGSIIWKRSGKVVEVTFLNVAFASQTSGDVTLATGLPPSNNYSWSVIKSLLDANVQQGVAVNTNGNLTSIGGSTGGGNYYDSFTYLAAD